MRTVNLLNHFKLIVSFDSIQNVEESRAEPILDDLFLEEGAGSAEVMTSYHVVEAGGERLRGVRLLREEILLEHTKLCKLGRLGGLEADPLEFYKRHSTVLPILARYGRYLFAISASSACAERAFSVLSNISTSRRERLAAATTSAIITCAHGLQTGIFDDLDDFESFCNTQPDSVSVLQQGTASQRRKERK